MYLVLLASIIIAFIFHAGINCKQLGINEIVFVLILWKYDTYSSCIDHKCIIFKSWYFHNYLVKKLRHWMKKTVWVTYFISILAL